MNPISLLVMMLLSQQTQDSSNPFQPILDALRDLSSQIAASIEGVLQRFIEQFARGIAEGTAKLLQQAYTFSVEPIKPLADHAFLFISSITFAVAQLSFIISLGLFVLPVNEDLSARGRNGMFDSAFSAALLSFTPAINSFFESISSLLSQAILEGVTVDTTAIVTNILISNISLAGLFFLIVDALALLMAGVLVVVVLLLSLLAPLLFSLGIATYSLPLQIAKSTSNRLFVQSLFLWFLAPIGYSIIALNVTLLSTVISPVTPLVIVVLDYLLLKISFSIAAEIGASHPVINTVQRVATSAVIFASVYLLKGKALVLFSGKKAKGSRDEQEVE